MPVADEGTLGGIKNNNINNEVAPVAEVAPNMTPEHKTQEAECATHDD
ncbi:MAG: hypothetical protein GY821_06445 [Gammaproteobacteria bacterium]|nr:hypothetical protein [Gammaproteobacteria bacterium]